jgi:hypothetical protein
MLANRQTAYFPIAQKFFALSKLFTPTSTPQTTLPYAIVLIYFFIHGTQHAAY